MAGAGRPLHPHPVPAGRRALDRRSVGSIVEYLFAPADPGAVLARLADPATRIVTLTVTEGGYNLDEATGQFRLDTPDVAHDLAHPEAPRTVFGFIVAGLERRRAAGAGPYTVLSCDNLQHNGDVIRRCVLAFAGARDPELADWIEANVTFPCCMVDRITPGVTADDAARLNARQRRRRRGAGVRRGLHPVGDRGPVLRRPTGAGAGRRRSSATRWRRTSRSSCGCSTPPTACCPTLPCSPATGSSTRRSPTGRSTAYLHAFLDRDVIPLLRAPAGMSLGGLSRHDPAPLLQPGHPRPARPDRLRRRGQDPGLPGRYAARPARGRRRPSPPRLPVRGVRPLSGRPRRSRRHVRARWSRISRRPTARWRPRATRRAFLSIANFKGLGLEAAPRFRASVLDYRKPIAAEGVLATLAAIAGGGKLRYVPREIRSEGPRRGGHRAPARASASPAPRRWARLGPRSSFPTCCRTGSTARSSS